MTEKRTPGVLLVNYLCHFLLSSFYCGAAVQWRQRRKTPSRMKWRFSAYRRRWRVMTTIVLIHRDTPKKETLPERRLRRGGERVQYSLSSLVAGGATWFAPG